MQRDGSCRYSLQAAEMIAVILVDTGASTARSVESLANTKWVALQERGTTVTTTLVREAYREHTGKEWSDVYQVAVDQETECGVWVPRGTQ